MATPVANFADVAVSTGYTAGDLSIVVESGGGSRFPSTFPYPIVWWNATDYSSAARDPNREIVKVSNRSADTFTIERAQEGTSATDKNITGKTYRVALCITKAMWEERQTSGEFHSGLVLGTHPSADIAHKTILLSGVDYIVMDDGTLSDNSGGAWNGLTADITTSGAGGLDTGSEAAANLYDIYAIAKEDGTRALLLHRAKVAALESFFTGADATQGIRSDAGNADVKVAQGFQISNSGKIPHVDLWLIKVGSPTGNLWVTLESSSAGQPTGVALATSYKIDVSRLSTTQMSVRIPMLSTSTFSASTQYHIVVQGDWAISGANYVGWRMDSTAGTYANGAKALFDSDTSSWTTDTDDDLNFSVYVDRHDTAVTMPSGYTKKCHLGYVNNGGGGGFSDFIPFRQLERSMRFINIMSVFVQNESLAGPTIYNLGSLVPSRNTGVLAHLALTGTGAAIATYAFGDWKAVDISSTTGVGASLVLHAPLTTEIPCAYGSIHVTNGAISGAGTTGADIYLAGFDW